MVGQFLGRPGGAFEEVIKGIEAMPLGMVMGLLGMDVLGHAIQLMAS